MLNILKHLEENIIIIKEMEDIEKIEMILVNMKTIVSYIKIYWK